MPLGPAALLRRTVLSVVAASTTTLACAHAAAEPAYAYEARGGFAPSASRSLPPTSSSSSSASASASAQQPQPQPLPLPKRYPSEYARLHPNLVVVESRALKALFTVVRDEATVHADFVAAADRLMRILAEEGLAHLPGTTERVVTTPTGAVFHGLAPPPAHTLAAVSIVRAGDTLLEAVRRCAPAVAVGKILIQRDETTRDKAPKLFYVKLPADIATRTVLLVDPMLATGGSAAMAIAELCARGVDEGRIVFLNVVACPEGLAVLAARYPRVRVVTAAVDDELNADRFIVPGLGDFGDRYCGTDA